LHYRFTRRKKELVDFAASESGMTAYFCARYKNQKMGGKPQSMIGIKRNHS
jgi:hypothetical protein